MTFTRTSSGIQNYPQFYNSDIVIYIEGKQSSNNEAPDKFFYDHLISDIIHNKSVFIKCVGNKSSAIEYASKIIDSGSKNSIVIIDRDYDGIHCSPLVSPVIIRTFGYSWENDLWTLELATDVLSDITIKSKPALVKLKIKFDSGERQLKLISILDAALQCNAQSLFPKDKKSFGICIIGKNIEPISKSELKRFVIKYKSSNINKCQIQREILQAASKTNPHRLIQGHLWCHFVTKIISASHTKQMNESAIPDKAIMNIALSKYSSNPRKYIGEAAYKYYQSELETRLL